MVGILSHHRKNTFTRRLKAPASVHGFTGKQSVVFLSNRHDNYATTLIYLDVALLLFVLAGLAWALRSFGNEVEAAGIVLTPRHILALLDPGQTSPLAGAFFIVGRYVSRFAQWTGGSLVH